MTRELQHVVTDAGFSRSKAKFIGECVGLVPVFMVCRRANDIRTGLDHLLPEKLRNGVVTLLTGQLVPARRTEYLGNRRIDEIHVDCPVSALAGALDPLANREYATRTAAGARDGDCRA